MACISEPHKAEIRAWIFAVEDHDTIMGPRAVYVVRDGRVIAQATCLRSLTSVDHHVEQFLAMVGGATVQLDARRADVAAELAP